MNSKVKSIILNLLRYLILTSIFVLTIFPLVWMFLTSFKERSAVFVGGLWPETFILDNYKFIMESLNIGSHFMNTAIITVLTVFLIVAFSTMAGYSFGKMDFPGKNIIFLVFIASLTIPPQVTIIPLFLILKKLGLLNSHLGLISSYTGLGIAFSLFLMRAFFSTVPNALRESAIIDGASEFRVFWQIMVPMAKPGIATITIFQFVSTWNEFLYAATLIQRPELRTIQPAIRSLVGRYSTNWGALTASMVIAVIPILITYLILQKQFIQGLTAGALKG